MIILLKYISYNISLFLGKPFQFSSYKFWILPTFNIEQKYVKFGNWKGLPTKTVMFYGINFSQDIVLRNYTKTVFLRFSIKIVHIFLPFLNWGAIHWFFLKVLKEIIYWLRSNYTITLLLNNFSPGLAYVEYDPSHFLCFFQLTFHHIKNQTTLMVSTAVPLL